jgi:diketogulonate reductase-like aldo/keto reductase
LAKTCGRTPAQVALNWCLCRDFVVVIPKSSSVEHVLENCGASNWRLSPEQVRELDESIIFRRRSRLETFLRRYVPPSVKRTIRPLVRLSPRALRRRIT